jgi:hypothetical protein
MVFAFKGEESVWSNPNKEVKLGSPYILTLKTILTKEEGQ